MKRILVHWYWKTGKKGHKRCHLYYALEDGRRKSMRGPRTGPHPNDREMRQWGHRAAVAAMEWERDLNKLASDFQVHMPVIKAAMQFLEYCDGNRRPGTIKRYDRILRQFSNWNVATQGPKNIGGLRVYHFTQFREYLIDKGLSGSTINCYLADLSSWNRWALGESYVTENFAAKINKVRASSGSYNGDTSIAIRGAAAYWEMLRGLRNDLQTAVIGLLACTGMRIGELRWLDWDSSWDHYSGVLLIGRWLKDTSTKKHGRMRPCGTMVTRYLQMLHCLQGRGRTLENGSDEAGPWVCGIRRGHDVFTSQVGTWLKPLGLTPKHLRQWFRKSLVTVAKINKMGDCTVLINDLMGHMMPKTRAAYEDNADLEGMAPIIEAFDKWLMAARPDMDKPRILPPMGVDESLGSGWGAQDRLLPTSLPTKGRPRSRRRRRKN